SFSTNVMYDSGNATELFHLTLQYTGADGEVYYDKVASGTAAKGEWVQLANTSYTIPAGATDLNLYVETDKNTCDFYIDDVAAAEKGTVIAGAGLAPIVTPGDVSCDGVINAVDIAMARQGIVSGFARAYNEVAADADQNGTVEINDVVLIQEFVLGQITEFPVYTPPKPAFNYDSAVSYHEPSNGENYLDRIAEAGTVTKEYYNGINGQKALNVYTPYGYDPSKKYNIFYLMHGGGENENTCFSDEYKLQNIFDHMIKNGEIEPMIVVCPTFNGCPSPDNNMGAGTVWDEMRQSIIPFVESKYSTYAEDTTIDGLRASRFHRAYGGFSMGSGSTWNNFCNNLDIIAYFMPLSGHCWLGAQGIQNAIDQSGFTQRDYFVFAATGDDDIAYGNMMTLMPTLQADTKRFTYTSDFSQGNLYFLVAPGKTHWWGVVRWYIYDALPYFFHEGT
ncbi:MAG: carbohydrate binding domain-containing protein, partial [Ruminococcus sp.]|nr:carbohydrate binding domain-containing protein [Ruminococcus sp.]